MVNQRYVENECEELIEKKSNINRGRKIKRRLWKRNL